MRLPPRTILASLAGLGCALTLAGQPVAADAPAAPGRIVIQVDQHGATLGPRFYGLMTEEINFSYEGGLYGELIQNRAMRNPYRGAIYPPAGNPPSSATIKLPPNEVAAWSIVASPGSQGEMLRDTSDPISGTALTTSLKLTIASVAPGGRVGVANEGFWGIPARPDSIYRASFYAKAGAGFTGPLTITLESNDGQTVHATAAVAQITDQWKPYHVALKTGSLAPSLANRLVISGAAKGTVSLNQVSLFPPVFRERTGDALGARPATGFRRDLMQLLADLKPGFLRFPGGNYLEGGDLPNRFDWKATIGPWERRPGHMSPWRYRSSDGLGLLEFLEWCEDLNIEPVLGLFAGLVLDRTVFTGDALKPFIDEALEEIEYVTGDVSTKWGAQRAKDGHPAPFKLSYVEIGNEDFLSNGTASYQGDQGRYALFHRAIKASYPNLQIIATTDPKSVHDVIDEHYYMNFGDALTRAHMYDADKRPRTTADGQPVPRVFVGEWATRDNLPTPSFRSALADAAFLTGLERNADLVIMSCYAPLFVNVSDIGGPTRSQQWATNLIGYNALNSFGSPSYYVQKMFGQNKGDVVLPVVLTAQIAPVVPAPAPVREDGTPGAAAPGGAGRGRGRGPALPTDTLFASSTRDAATGDVILKVVNAVEQTQRIEIALEGNVTVGEAAKMEVLTGGLTEVNSIAEPMKVAPKTSTIAAGRRFNREFPGNSVTVLRLTTR